MVKGTVSVKVKGTAHSACGQGLKDCVDGMRVWDTTDLVTKTEDSAFVTTAITNTIQNQTKCAGTHADPASPDTFNEDCTQGGEQACQRDRASWSGVQTGACLPPSEQGMRWCEVRGWCPAEDSEEKPLLLEGVDSWTLFIKLQVHFSKFGSSWDNANGTELVRGWNLFSVADILDKAGLEWNNETRQDGVDVLMQFALDCNLDNDQQCVPEITVERTDLASSLSKGYNERTAVFFSDAQNKYDDGLSRELWKRYGVKVRVLLTGSARKFDFGVAATRLGAGLALLSVATVVADLVIIWLLPRRKDYYHAKYEEVYVGEDAGDPWAVARTAATGYEDEFEQAWEQGTPTQAPLLGRRG